MVAAAPHVLEQKRVEALHKLQILDTDAQDAWDRIAQLASLICESPIALVSLVDTNRQWFKARVGLEALETSRDDAFCAHAILENGTFIVPDATKDARFSDNPLVLGDPDIRFYAGRPIFTDDGLPLGTVCAIDNKPRELTSSQLSALELLAKDAESLVRVRAAGAALLTDFATESWDKSREAINAMAHDIMTPLTPTVLALARLKLESTPEQAEAFETIERNIKRLQETVQEAANKMQDAA